MSRRKRKPPRARLRPHALQDSTRRTAARRRPAIGRRAAIALCALLTAGLAWWAWQQWGGSGSAPPPPRVALNNLEPSLAKALQRWIDEVKAHPRSGEAWGRLGSLLHVYGHPEADRCLQLARQFDPRNPRWPYFQALRLRQTQPNQAIETMREAVRLCGNTPPVPRFRLAQWLAEAGRWDEAARELEALQQAHPDFAPASLLLARRALMQGQINQAIGLASRCTNDTRTAKAAWTLLGVLRRRQGEVEAATQAVNVAAKLPKDRKVADPYEAEVAELRGDPRVWSDQVHTLLAAGKLDEAAPIIQRLLKDYPAFTETWLLHGRYQYLRNNLAEAERAFRQYLEMEPGSAQGLFQLGMVLMRAKRYEEAADLFARAVKIKADFGPAFYNRGYCLALAGKLQEAIEPFQQAIRLSPEHLDSYFMLAQVHLRLGHRAEAQALLDKAKLLAPDDPRLVQLRAALQQPPPNPATTNKPPRTP